MADPNEILVELAAETSGEHKEKRVRLRKNAQQALLYMMGKRAYAGKLQMSNRRFYPNTWGRPQTADSAQWTKRQASRSCTSDEPKCYTHRSGYKQIVPIESDGNYPPEVSTSVLATPPQGTSQFFTFEMTPAQMAVLVPRIRIFKIDYKYDEDTKRIDTDIKKATKREIIFDKAITDEELNILVEKGGNVGSSGIESFEWKLKGVNPAEVDSNIIASLKIYFNNIGVFQKTIDRLHRGEAAPTVASDSSPLELEASFLDLITFAPPTAKNVENLPCLEEYEPAFFEIMAEVGWEVPPVTQQTLLHPAAMDLAAAGLSETQEMRAAGITIGDSDGDGTPDQVHFGDPPGSGNQTLQERDPLVFHPDRALFTLPQIQYIKNSSLKLLLTLTDHKFDFAEDGSATLEANYRARSTMVAEAKYDILGVPHSTLNLEEEIQNMDGSDEPTTADEDADVSVTLAKKKSAESKAKLHKERLHASLRSSYQRILRELLLWNMYEATIPNALLLNFEAQEARDPLGTPNDTNPYRVHDRTLTSRSTALSFNSLLRVIASADAAGTTTMREVAYAKMDANAVDYAASRGTLPFASFGQGHLATMPSQRPATSGAPGDTAAQQKAWQDAYDDPEFDQTGNELFMKNLSKIQGLLAAKDDKGKTNPPPVKIKRIKAKLGSTVGKKTPNQKALDKILDGKSDLAQGDFLDSDPNALNNYGDISPHADGTSRIPFFYLGDILEVFLTSPGIVEAVANQKLAIVTTDVKFLNYFSLINSIVLAGQKNQFEVKTATMAKSVSFEAIKCKSAALPKSVRDQLYDHVNIAHIPISAQLFLDFFAEKITSRQATVYYLEDFIRDLFNLFVKPIVADQGILGVPINYPAFININVDTDNKRCMIFRGAQGGEKIGYDEKRQLWSDLVGGRLKKTDPSRAGSRGVDDANKPVTDSTGIRAGESYIASLSVYKRLTDRGFEWITPNAASRIHGAGQVTQRYDAIMPPPTSPETAATVKILGFLTSIDNFNGNYEDNMKKGMANFIVGLSRGIIKSVEFDRVDQPHLREARAAKSRTFALGQLRELYNVTLTMYGNNLLKPGELIYVEPNPIVFGKPTSKTSVARILGLGGYHMVVDVSHSISKDGWETVAKALFMAAPAVPE